MAAHPQVFIIYGSDSWLRQQQRQKLTQQWQKVHPASVTEVLSEDLTLGALTQCLGTLNFFSPERLILIKNAELMVGWTEAQLVALAELHQSLDENTRVLYLAGKELGQSKQAKKLIALGQAVPCLPLTEWQQAQAQSELQTWAKAAGKQLEPRAAQVLVEWIGPTRPLLASELEKAIAYVGERSKIEAGDIAAVSSASHLAPFAVTDALLTGAREPFFKALDARLEHEHPLPILSLLAGQFRTLIALWELRGQSSAACAEALGKSEFVVKKSLPALSRWPAERCRKALSILHDVDVTLKTGCNHPEVFMLNAMTKVWAA